MDKKGMKYNSGKKLRQENDEREFIQKKEELDILIENLKQSKDVEILDDNLNQCCVSLKNLTICGCTVEPDILLKQMKAQRKYSRLIEKTYEEVKASFESSDDE